MESPFDVIFFCPALYHCTSKIGPLIALNDLGCPVGRHQFSKCLDCIYLVCFLHPAARLQQPITAFQSYYIFLLPCARPETKIQWESEQNAGVTTGPSRNHRVTWTSNSARRVGSNIPNAWACLTASFACWKVSCSILPQSHTCPFFISLSSGEPDPIKYLCPGCILGLGQ